MSRSPLFQVMFVLQNNDQADIRTDSLSGVALMAESIGYSTSKFDLTFVIEEQADGLQVSIEYCSDLYQEATIRRMFGHYEQLLRSVVKDADCQIDRLKMLTEAEEQEILEEFNATSAIYPNDKTIVDLFEAQVERTPDKVAIVFEDVELSYRELNARANQLGHYLRSKGVKEEVLVPICIDRSIEMIVGILGILKAGGGYVPIDRDLSS